MADKAIDIRCIWKPLLQKKQSLLEETISCLEDGSSFLTPSVHTLLCILHQCREERNAESSLRLQTLIRRCGLKTHEDCANGFVSLLSEVDRLTIAQDLFNSLSYKKASGWNSLFRAYLASGSFQKAFTTYERMYEEIGLQPTKHLLISLAKLCGLNKDLEKCRKIHVRLVICESESEDSSIGKDPYLGNAIVDMYAKCGSLSDAREVFGNILVKGVFLWTTLISAYAKHDEYYGEQALMCYEEMLLDGFFPDLVTLTCVLKACARLGFAEKGKEMHALVCMQGFERDHVVGSSLVDMYCDCGLLKEAQQVFDKVQVKDVVIWTSLISGYTEHGDGEKALICFEAMQLEGLLPNNVTFVCCLKACGTIGAIRQGREIHVEVARKGLLELVEHDEIDHKKRFHRNELFEKVHCTANDNRKGSVELVEHAEIEHRKGLVERGHRVEYNHRKVSSERARLSVGNAVIDLYAKCGLMVKAKEVFKSLSIRDVISWNVLISGFENHGNAKEALGCYAEMRRECIFPDETTFVYLLKACGRLCDAKKGQEIHHEIVRRGLLRVGLHDKGQDIHQKIFKRGILGIHVVGNALLDMYAKCGLLAKAQEIFDNLQSKDIVSYNALLLGCIKHGRNHQSMECFKQMQCDGIAPDAVTFLCMLKACGNIGAVETGERLHMDIVEEGVLLDRDLGIGNALVDMYARCGLLSKAHYLFNELPVRDIITWTTLIAGYAQLGEYEKVVSTFEHMRGESVLPSSITFVSVLNVCTHGGLVEMGELCFRAMATDYNINLALEHYTCLIDLFCRADQLCKAIWLIENMPSHPDLVVWHTLLGACQRWSDVDLGRRVFKHVVQLDEKNPASYVFMSNVFVDHEDICRC